jgi:hypothetical protein
MKIQKEKQKQTCTFSIFPQNDAKKKIDEKCMQVPLNATNHNAIEVWSDCEKYNV